MDLKECDMEENRGSWGCLYSLLQKIDKISILELF